MATGSLHTKFNDRGFTFIAVEGEEPGSSPAVFLHIGQLVLGQDAKEYVRGRQVEFEIVTVVRSGEERRQARNARLLPGGAQSIGAAAVVRQGLRGSIKFWSPIGYGFITDEQSGVEYYVKSESAPGGYLRPGDVIQFDVQDSGGKTEAVNVVVLSWATTGEPFTDQLDMGGPNWAARLKDMAEQEDWNYKEKPARDSFAILRSYLKYTFLRLNELSQHVLVSADESTLSFNTGLVTPFQEQIFAIFRRRDAVTQGPPWILRSFEKASNVTFLQMFGGSLPPLAWYHSEPGQLIFDTRVPLYVNVEHVPHDPERFPEALKSLTPQDLAALVNSKAPEAIERVRRNYKTAIPQFYREGISGQGKMQLLLPVALLSTDSVQLALAVDRLDQSYLGRTVLPLDWAYNNARLLTRPDNDWLRP